MRPIQSPARRRALLCALREGHGYTSAAAACGVADRTFREWRADDAAFAEQCLREAADFAGDIAEHTLYQRGIKGETLALLAWLRAHKPEKYHRKMLLALDQTERPATTPDTGAWIYPRTLAAQIPRR